MKYCKKCVQTDTRPNIVFDKDGVCLACRFAEESQKIDWAKRKKELEEIARDCKKSNVSGYDCIVGVSGGKDSTFQALYIRDELGLKPLLVSCTYPPEQVTEIGMENLSNLASMGFDLITVSPDPKVWKKLMLHGFLKHGNFLKAPELALYASAPKVAIAYHIPFIFLGENPAITFGVAEVGSLTGDANGMKNCNTLGGGDAKKWLTDDITDKDVYWYRYPTDEEMEWGKLRIIYLGYYTKDFTSHHNAEFAIKRGLKIRHEPPGDIGDIYGVSALDDSFVMINQMLKFLKFGFAKVTDQLGEMVRMGLMDRQEALKLIKKYDGGSADRFIRHFCDFVGISEKKFWQEAEKWRNKDIWEKDKNGKMKIKWPE